LRLLLKKRDEDRAELEEKVLSNVKELVLTYLEKLKRTGLNQRQKTFASILESNIDDIISPFLRRMSLRYLSLTPAQIQVAILVRQGKKTKEIAALLDLSPKTIEDHRKNLRKKFGLKNKRALTSVPPHFC
jgi:DNA-binding CsgD family transcriptional regulator